VPARCCGWVGSHVLGYVGCYRVCLRLRCVDLLRFTARVVPFAVYVRFTHYGYDVYRGLPRFVVTCGLFPFTLVLRFLRCLRLVVWFVTRYWFVTTVVYVDLI
jgi:hypothetical protein